MGTRAAIELTGGRISRLDCVPRHRSRPVLQHLRWPGRTDRVAHFSEDDELDEWLRQGR